MQAFGLHPEFGVEVRHVDLRAVTADHLYPEIRELFERHSLLLFRGQDLDEPAHRALAELFGPLEDLRDAEPGVPPTRPMVSNVATDGGLELVGVDVPTRGGEIAPPAGSRSRVEQPLLPRPWTRSPRRRPAGREHARPVARPLLPMLQ